MDIAASFDKDAGHIFFGKLLQEVRKIHMPVPFRSREDRNTRQVSKGPDLFLKGLRRDDKKRVCRPIRKDLTFQGKGRLAVKDDTQGIFSFHETYGKGWIILGHGFSAHQDGVIPAAQAMRIRSCLDPGNPLGIARNRSNLAIKGHGVL